MAFGLYQIRSNGGNMKIASNRALVVALIVILFATLTGCSNVVIENNKTNTNNEANIDNDTNGRNKTNATQFVIINKQTVDIPDSFSRSIDITRIADLNTGVIYIYTRQTSTGTTWSVEINADGLPVCLSEEELEALRTEHGWQAINN